MTSRRYELLDRVIATGVVPDFALTAGARWSARSRARAEARGGVAAQEARLVAMLNHMSTGPIAEVPAKANEQHYELPAEFMALFMGARRKYSCCYWPSESTTLDEAEDAMLRLTCERAGVRDGMRVLDLGCGWGALSLYLAEHFDVQVVGVSNSNSQREWIEAERDRRGLTSRLTVITADVNDFEPDGSFDRVMSVEMFEHLRNWKELLRRINTWLKPEGALFVHVFSHRTLAYRFENTWFAERFFTAGTMPSHELLTRFTDDFILKQRWAIDGTHYARTLDAWLKRFDAAEATGRTMVSKELFELWRVFFVAARESWAYRDGNEWMVSHYLLEPR